MPLTLSNSNQVLVSGTSPDCCCSQVSERVVSTAQHTAWGCFRSFAAPWGISISSSTVSTLTSVNGLLLVTEYKELLPPSAQPCSTQQAGQWWCPYTVPAPALCHIACGGLGGSEGLKDALILLRKKAQKAENKRGRQ